MTSWVMVTCCQTDRMADRTENITFPQLRWLAIKIHTVVVSARAKDVME